MLWSLKTEKNLIGLYINVQIKQVTNQNTGIGGGIDSLYEYMLKSYILFGEAYLLDIFDKSYVALETFVRKGYVFGTSRTDGAHVNSVVESLSAFWPGVQVIN